MWALEHFVGVTSLAVTLDYFLFNGYCTKVSAELFSQAYMQLLSEWEKPFGGFPKVRLAASRWPLLEFYLGPGGRSAYTHRKGAIGANFARCPPIGGLPFLLPAPTSPQR